MAKRNQILYVLDEEKRPIAEKSERKWSKFMSKNRVLFKSTIGGIDISTVFLGFDHRYLGEGPPLLFETIVFRGETVLSVKRYSSYDDAMTGHKVEMIKIHRGMNVK